MAFGTIKADTIQADGGTAKTVDNLLVSGADIDIGGQQITTTSSNQDIELAAHGTGAVEVRGNTNAGTIKLNCENNSHAVSVQGPAHSAAATYTLVLPTAAGTANQILDIASVNGSTMQLGWADDESGAGTGANTFTATQSVTPDDATSDTAINMSLSNFIEVGSTNPTNAPTNLVVGTSGVFYADTAAPTSWHSTFKHPGGAYTAPTAFPAIAPWYIAETNEILVGSWTQGIA